MQLNPITARKSLRAVLALAGLAAALVAGAAAPGASAHGSFPAHVPGRVACAGNPLTGMSEVTVAVPERFLGMRAASERVAFRPVLYRWNGSVWAPHRVGTWAYTTTSAGGSPVAQPTPSYADGNGNIVRAQTFSPLERGHYAVLVQFWWSSTRAIHGVFASRLSGASVSGTYCTL